MKTAISIPDHLFEQGESLARQLGTSRSQLYVRALTAFMETHNHVHITVKLDELYGEESSELEPPLQSMQAEAIGREDW